MGFRYRKQFKIGGVKFNVGKNGITSTSVKVAPGVTLNSKRGLTVGIPGTGMSYNTGGTKARKPTAKALSEANTAKVLEHEKVLERKRVKKEYNKGWTEFTGGYNKNAKIAIAVSIAICLTPFSQLGTFLLISSVVWLTIDASKKTRMYKEHLRNSSSF